MAGIRHAELGSQRRLEASPAGQALRVVKGRLDSLLEIALLLREMQRFDSDIALQARRCLRQRYSASDKPSAELCLASLGLRPRQRRPRSGLEDPHGADKGHLHRDSRTTVARGYTSDLLHDACHSRRLHRRWRPDRREHRADASTGLAQCAVAVPLAMTLTPLG